MPTLKYQILQNSKVKKLRVFDELRFLYIKKEKLKKNSS